MAEARNQKCGIPEDHKGINSIVKHFFIDSFNSPFVVIAKPEITKGSF
jgi:hypothetical protein